MPVNMPEDDSQNILVPQGDTEVEGSEADLGDETTDEGFEAEESPRVNMPEDGSEIDDYVAASETDPEQGDEGDTYTITVDGEELEVTLEEALSGYQRQSAFTRKTQELAQEREQLAHMAQLAQALDRDPQGTILSMARNLGIDLGATAQPQETAPANPLSGVDLEDLDPEVVTLFQALTNEIQSLKGQVTEVDGWRQQQTNAEFEASIDREADAVAIRHGVPAEEFDKGELYRFAADHNIGDLDAAFVYMREVKAATAAPPPAAVKSKRTAKQALRTEGGRHRVGTKPIARGKMNLEEAMAKAAQDVGIQFAD
jgi:hypothetical protein